VSSNAALLQQQQGGDTIEAGDKFGAVLATGNFNNDSFTDLVVGAPGEDSGAGAVSVFMGSPTGLGSGTIVKQSHTPGGTNVAGDRFGAAIATGDVSGDGMDDLVVGIPGKDTESGAVAVYLGGALGISRAQALFLFSNSVGCGSRAQRDDFGWAVAIGDFNQDPGVTTNYEDVAIGVPGKDSDKGSVCVVKGKSGGLSGASGAVYNRDTVQNLAPPALTRSAAQRFGSALAAGVVTAGNQADLVIGSSGGGGDVIALFGRGTSPTAPWAFFKSQTETDPPAVAELSQSAAGHTSAAGDRHGEDLLVADMNRDGLGDVIVGAPGKNTLKNPSSPGESIPGAKGGAVFVFHGAPNGPVGGAWYQQSGSIAGAGTEAGDEFGAALAAGDFDDDGVAELAVGSPYEGPASDPDTSGMVSLHAASYAGLEVGSYFTQEDLSGNSEAGDLMGAALAVGRFNDDAFPDLAIGAPGEAPGGSPAGGYVYVRAGAGASTSITVGPILRAVTDNTIKVWVRANQATNFQVKYTKVGGAEEADDENLSLTSATDFTGMVTLTELEPNSSYTYRVLLNGVQKFAGTFRTLPAEQVPGQLVFTYGADLKLDFRPYVLASKVEADLPHFMILGGDNIYADRFVSTPNSKAGYEARYRQTFADGPLRSLMQKVPMFMTWDDHEIYNNWDGQTGGRYANARAAYDEYQESHNTAPGQPLYYSFRAGEVDFFVLDTRSYRKANCVEGNAVCVNESDRSMLDGTFNPSAPGPQLSALLQWLDTSWGKFKVIVSSVPFDDLIDAVDEEDAWRGFKQERDFILDYINDEGIGGVVLLSGDQHWSGVFVNESNPPYRFHEFMATPMGVDTRPMPDLSEVTRVLYQNNSYRGYGRFTVNTAVTPATLKYEWVVDNGGVPCPAPGNGSICYSKTISASDISPW
jgi:phosphodiesterase/alkaline phosphatase D-like protein